MPYKFTMLFNLPGGGFSESWYWNAAVGLPVSGSNPFDDLYARRTEMCSGQVEAIGWKLIDTANPRVSQVKIYPKATTSSGNADEPTAAWLAIAKGDNNVGRRQLWLRGLPDDAIKYDDTNKRFVTSTQFDSSWPAYKALLIAGALHWSINHVQSKKEALPNVYAVSSLVPSLTTANLHLTSVTTIDPTLPMIVGGFKKPLSKLNGTYLPATGYTSDGTGVNLIGKVIPTVQANGYPGGAFIRQSVKTLIACKNIELEFARSRRVGRAFFEERGRR